MKLAWGQKVSAQFRSKLAGICERLGIYPSWLMACIAFETGRTFSPSVRNPVSGATGLIQFMPSTARALGTTCDDLAAMSAEEQLDFVEKYLEPYRGMLGGIEDVYMSILWPRGVGKPSDYILFSAGSAAYAGKKGLDLDKDGLVTKEEASRKVVQLLEEGMIYAYEEDQAPSPVEKRDTVAALEEQVERPV